MAMAIHSKFRLKPKDQDAYLSLVRAFPLASIQSDVHLAAAGEVMDRLLARGKLTAGETLYLEALADLVAVHEDQHHRIEAASDAEMLRHLLEAKGVTQARLSEEAGLAKSSVSEVLARKKPFGRQMIRKLAGFFQVDVSVLAGNL